MIKINIDKNGAHFKESVVFRVEEVLIPQSNRDNFPLGRFREVLDWAEVKRDMAAIRRGADGCSR